MRHAPLSSRPLSIAALALATLVPEVAAGQLTVTRLGHPPGATTTVARGLNDQGHVVGHSFFSQGATMRGWIWRPGSGFELLPQPPGHSTWTASDVNEAGAICGDGGYGFGEAWRYDAGSYALLGFLPNGDASTAHAIDELGRVVCTSRDSGQFTVPPVSFLAVPGQAPQPVAAGGFATALNDAGQIAGYTTANKAFRASAASGMQVLGNLGVKPLSWAWSIHAHGHVVGDAASANGHNHRPFLYTDQGGMQEIGSFGHDAVAISINDAGTVVGEGGAPWIWSAAAGVQALWTLIDPAEQIGVLDVMRINDAGQVLCGGLDLVTGDRFPVLLTPSAASKAFVNLGLGLAGASGVPQLAASLTGAAGVALELELAQAAPHAPFLLAFATARADVPLLGGVLVPDVLTSGGALALATDATGGFAMQAPWPTDWPAGVQLFLQAWIVDAGAPQGISASNAIASPLP